MESIRLTFEYNILGNPSIYKYLQVFQLFFHTSFNCLYPSSIAINSHRVRIIPHYSREKRYTTIKKKNKKNKIKTNEYESCLLKSILSQVNP